MISCPFCASKDTIHKSVYGQKGLHIVKKQRQCTNCGKKYFTLEILFANSNEEGELQKNIYEIANEAAKRLRNPNANWPINSKTS